MPGPARAGLFLYARDLGRLARFYEGLLGSTRVHASDDIVVLDSSDIQLVLHAIPAATAATLEIASPPLRREEAALKFFFTVPSLSDAAARAPALGGEVLAEQWQGRASSSATRSIRKATSFSCARPSADMKWSAVMRGRVECSPADDGRVTPRRSRAHLAATSCASLLALVLASGSSAMAADECAPATLAQQLVERAARDQDARQALVASPTSAELSRRASSIDADNTAYMREVVEHCGWPKRSRVGDDAARAAWLLTQHADMAPDYQVRAAQWMKYAVLAGEADGASLALLVDRNRRLTDQPQVYGMQTFVATDGVVRFHDIVTPAQLDARRAELRLVPFYCHALAASRRNGDAAIEWPQGVLLRPVDCAATPAKHSGDDG